MLDYRRLLQEDAYLVYNALLGAGIINHTMSCQKGLKTCVEFPSGSIIYLDMMD
jgi:hypothetical protein